MIILYLWVEIKLCESYYWDESQCVSRKFTSIINGAVLSSSSNDHSSPPPPPPSLSQISRHSNDMMWYIIFLRITPFLPNWFINLASPIIGVKISPFFWGTFLGVAPPSFFFIRAGTTLYELTTSTGHISLGSILILAALAVLSLTPVLYKRLTAAR